MYGGLYTDKHYMSELQRIAVGKDKDRNGQGQSKYSVPRVQDKKQDVGFCREKDQQ